LATAVVGAVLAGTGIRCARAADVGGTFESKDSPVIAQTDILRQGGQACFFGAAVLGTSSLLVLYPVLFSRFSTAPVLQIIAGNSLFGCGIAMVGAAAAEGFGMLYDGLVGGVPASATPAERH